MNDSNYTPVDLRLISACKRCGAVIDMRRRDHHSEFHKKLDTLMNLFGWAEKLDSQDEIPY